MVQIEVWVQVADAQAMVLDCKEYYAPIVTPFEAQLAFLDKAWDPSEYEMDFAALLDTRDDAGAASESGCVLPMLLPIMMPRALMPVLAAHRVPASASVHTANTCPAPLAVGALLLLAHGVVAV